MAKFKLLTSKNLRNLAFKSASRSSLVITSILVLFICLIRQLGSLQFFELAVFDLMMRWDKIQDGRSLQQNLPELRITLIGITESDIQAWQQSTFSDQLIARLIAKLQKYNPKVIGLDIYRDLPQPPGHQELLKQLEAKNIIAIKNVNQNDGVPAPPNVPEARVGFNNFLLDDDGRVRRNFMSAKMGDKPDGQGVSPDRRLATTGDASASRASRRNLYSFGLQLSKSYLDTKDTSLEIKQNYLKLNQTVFPTLKADSGGYQLSNSDVFGSQILLKYQPLETIARQLSFTQILDGNFEPSWIENKVIIIGYTAPSKKDIFSTPYGAAKMPGVAIHAQMANQILSTVLDRQPLFRFLPEWGEIVWIWAWSIMGAILVWRIKHPLALGGSLIITLAGLSVICFGGFLATVWLPIVPSAIGLVGTTGVILAHKTFYRSLVDELTGLANREQILTLLQQSIVKPKNSLIAVISIDIERFQTVNDSLGKQIGDRLIVLAGKRIQNSIRSQDKPARIGNATFAVALLTLKDREQAIAIAKRIQKDLAQVFNIQGQEIVISTNLGIAFHHSGEKIQAEELLRNSNIAQDRAQISGKNQYAIFTPKMHSETVAQWQLENDLRQAIANQEFELYYQPIINLKTDRIAGFEALVRWISPTRGFVSPGEFIPLAEATGLIISLGDWILRTACQQMYQWHQQFSAQQRLTISINLSSHQFLPDLVQQVEQILAETKLNSQCLKLEITESAMMDNVKEAIALLQQLKALGIKLSIDDFGTGYSSLSYLQQFGADTLKVDQSFVRQMEQSDKDKAIVDIIITLARKLDMEVIAEGIETENHQHILKALNCEYGQGYFFAKPLKSEDATKLLAQQFSAHHADNSI